MIILKRENPEFTSLWGGKNAENGYLKYYEWSSAKDAHADKLWQ